MVGLTILSLLVLPVHGRGFMVQITGCIAANSLWELLSSSVWKPNEGKFGFLPYIIGTLSIRD